MTLVLCAEKRKKKKREYKYYRLSLMGGKGEDYGSECFEMDVKKQSIEDNKVGVGDTVWINRLKRKGMYKIINMREV